MKQLADEALRELQPVFDEMYSSIGRPSIPPEHLLKATLLMALYGLRSERLFCEQLGYNMLFKWFLDMELADEPFDPNDVRQESQAHDGVRGGDTLLRSRRRTSPEEEFAQQRALFGGRHAARVVRVDEELSAKGRRR